MSDDEIKMAFQRIPFEERKQHFSHLNEILRKLSVINHSTKPDKSKFLEVPRDYEEYIKSMYYDYVFRRVGEAIYSYMVRC